MSKGKTAAELAQTYAKSFANHEHAASFAMLAQEFPGAIGALKRFGVLGPRILACDEPVHELLHECILAILEGKLPTPPQRGDCLRLAGRLAYATIRKHGQRERILTSRALAATTEHSATDEDLEGDIVSENESKLDPALSKLLAENKFRKENGSLHRGKATKALGLTEKALSRRLQALARRAGRDESHKRYWLKRLGECLLQWLEELTEARCQDLLPTQRKGKRAWDRLPLVLDSLSRIPLEAKHREPVRIVRRLVRENKYREARASSPLRSDIRRAAYGLCPDPFPIILADVEWHLASGDSLLALTTLEAMPRTLVQQRRFASGRPRFVLYGLVHARCLEHNGRVREALDVLEALPARHKKVPLFAHNRLVLARSLADEAASKSATFDLHKSRLDAPGLSPILRQRIRELLHQAS